MSWLARWVKRKAADRPKPIDTLKPWGSFVMEAEWERSEELRPDRLGPSQDDVEDPIPVDQWRPRKTLGGWTRYR